MKIVLALVIGVVVCGCGAGAAGDTPGPEAAAGGKAMSNEEADKAMKNVPPEAQARIREERAKAAGMQQSGPPPSTKK